jgi:hypothetical protein
VALIEIAERGEVPAYGASKELLSVASATKQQHGGVHACKRKIELMTSSTCNID